MKNKKKSFMEKWNIIKYPLFALMAWTIINTVVSLPDYINEKLFLVLLWTVNLAAFGYVGYLSIKLKKDERFAARSGIILGVFSGFFAAVIGILLIYIFPETLNELVKIAVSQGKDPDSVRKMANIGVYLNLVISPLISGIVGGFISWLAALISNIAIKKKK